MKLKLWLALVLLSTSLIQAQDKNNFNFKDYASHQDELMMKAYDQRDVKAYQTLLDDFLSKYNKLPKSEQENYENNHINAYYNFCCTYALLNNKPKALEFLEKSIKAGYLNYQHIQTDTDLESIRNEEKYKKLVYPLREVSDYLYIIKKSGTYNLEENRPFQFTYQSQDNPYLVALRKEYKLDSIAGKGNEQSKILNLMHWIHNLVPHDGSHGNPEVKNAKSMITVCKNEKRGLNCRGLAIVLNECYLSMGIRSRYVTCLPKDSLGIDTDCHVINMVYSNKAKKWLWIDPTFDAYVMNEKGELLSIEEVRECIINDKPLILNPEANWNHQNSQTKEYYLYNYMAKNLYMLECALNSEYDLETAHEGKEIQYLKLIPLDYFKKSLEPTINENTVTKTKAIKNKTNNPNVFWQVP
jgi:hypothetical protein